MTTTADNDYSKYANHVELLTYSGSDKLHCISAWASTSIDCGFDTQHDNNNDVDGLYDSIVKSGIKMRDGQKLLTYLAEHGHTSPFRTSSFVFAMNTDIATHIQKLKHRVILEAENGESARYKELKHDKFYVPLDWPVKWQEKLIEQTNINQSLYHECLTDLRPTLGHARAKESARFFLPYNTQLTTINKMSFDGVVQFYNKRSASDAQREIADVATKMVDCVRNIEGNPFKYSLAAFGI